MSYTGALLWAALVFWLARKCLRTWKAKRDDAAFAQEHGCLPVETVLPYSWPLGLDLLQRQLEAAQAGRLLSFQSPFLKEMPTMKVNILGGLGYFTTEPRIVESILKTNFQDWGVGSRTGGIYPLLGEGIFTQEGARWSHSREMLRHQFARVGYSDLRVFDAHVEDMVSCLRASKETVDLQPAFLRYTFATTTSLIFGDSFDHTDMEDRHTLGQHFDYAQMIVAIRIRLAGLYWLYAPKKFVRATANIKSYAMKCVNHVLDRAEERDDQAGNTAYSQNGSLIRNLYQELDNRELVRDQLIHVLTAGRDTTAFTMSWVIFLLVRHPRCLEGLQAEIASVLSLGGKLTRSHLIKMTYLRNVIDETLRLYPQIPANLRSANKRTVLPMGGGPDGTSPVFIPKDVVVGFSVYHMHRREDLYGPDAEVFRPERWEDGNLKKEVGWGYVAFHGGPRICLGKDFALAEASYGIVAILRAFPNLRLPPGTKREPIGEEKQDFGLFVASAEGCKVALE